MKVLFVVTHLLGTGHLTRMLTLARAFRAAGHDARVVSGGMPPPHLALEGEGVVQLPPVRSNGVDFSILLDTDGAIAGEDLMAQREEMLVHTLRDFAPDVLICELFPFGRRILRAEFLALLEAAKGRTPLILASVRDILAPPSKPAKLAFAEETLASYFDGVLVHSDPQVTPLDLSWPVSETTAKRLHYTGFVCPPPPEPHAEQAGAGAFLVSAGGGDVGATLYETAKAAAVLDPSRRWHLLLGGQDAPARAAALMQDAPANLLAEPARPDFRQMLHHAAASVSLCGYNTALDVLQTACPAVFVPFDAGGEVEQGIRAQALAAQDGIEMLRTQELTPETLLAAITAAQAAPRVAISPSVTRGAARTVEIVEALHGV